MYENYYLRGGALTKLIDTQQASDNVRRGAYSMRSVRPYGQAPILSRHMLIRRQSP